MTRISEAPRPTRRSIAEALIEALPLPTLAISDRERVLFANSAAELLLAPLGGVSGRSLERAFGPNAPLLDLVRRVWASNGPLSASDLEIPTPGGRGAIRVDVHAALFEDGKRVALSFVPRGRAHSEVAPEAVSALARTLAHEVRNPLAGIRAAAQLIARTGGGAHAELLDLIVAETDRIHRLTERIDALEGLPPPRLGPVNVHEALERVRGVIASSFPELRLRERYDPSLPLLHADFDQLIQAFLNIAKNGAEAAAAARGAGAALTLSTAFRSGVRMRAGASGRPRKLVEVAIEDNGPGLPPGLEGRAFEPFFTTKRGGVGLGLAVSAEIVARHDGRIEVESSPGATVFRVLLPLCEISA